MTGRRQTGILAPQAKGSSAGPLSTPRPGFSDLAADTEQSGTRLLRKRLHGCAYAEVFFCFPSNRPLSLQVQKRNSFPFRLQTVGEGRKERWVHGVPILYSDPAASSPRHGEPGGGPYHPAGPGTHRKKWSKRPAGGEKKAGVAGVFGAVQRPAGGHPRCGCGDLYALGQRGEHHRHLCRAHP